MTAEGKKVWLQGLISVTAVSRRTWCALLEPRAGHRSNLRSRLLADAFRCEKSGRHLGKICIEI
jgi:hypothetical protein